ncbi:putative Ig domain-containing protein [Hymenobacter chitinivorans]|uniref:Uncharacterized protein n=1 Tax=Hymenobacter chitinivorans DSM 11115 TaxID=1121954 RepID=A0A2M9BAJ5_9BACT|nr:putative Ig domain-containing protein [Hymenobacter chitinivorans]PJJ54968.1 hypothetical protein CLV45_3316 [Hymenobacter chitinivorans DSM 11115]
MQHRFLLRLLFLGLIGLGWSVSARASHILGGDLTYESLGNFSDYRKYRVTVRYYRDISTSVETGPKITLLATKDGCSLSTPGSLSATLYRTSQTIISPAGCASGFSYQLNIFEGEVMLERGQWLLSVNEENRSAGMRNVVNSAEKSFHVEAYLNNRAFPANNSPKFTSFTLPYLCGNQAHRYSFSSFDVDGDSLVYEPVQPQTQIQSVLDPCSVDIPYSSYPAGLFTDPVSGQTGGYSSGTYSAAYPLASFQVINGVAQPYFQLNPATGELLAQPQLQATGPYIVAVRVNEFRKLAGTWTRIGSVTRDVIYTVFNGQGNRNPVLSGLQIDTNPAAQSPDQLIPVAAGQTITLTLSATDPDAGQTTRISSDVASSIPGASFQTLTNGRGQLTWQVPATLKPGRYRCTVTVADNANCPFSGSEVRTLTFQVSGTTLATKAASPQILTAFPLPFHDQVQFQLAARTTQTVVITDELGREVARLNSRPDGLVIWQPAAAVPAGLYLARTADGRQVARLLHSAQ